MDSVRATPARCCGQADWLAAMQQGRHDVTHLRAQVRSLQRENRELRQQAGYWKAQHARAVQRHHQLEAEVERLQGENRQLQSQLFGRQSEKSTSADRRNVLDGEQEDTATPRQRGQQPDCRVPNDATTGICRCATTSASCPPSSVSARSAKGR